MKQVRFTPEGLDKFQKEYEELLAQRPAAVEDLQKSRELGDLSENGFYKAARMKLSSIDARLRRMAFTLKNAIVIENKLGNINIGSRVRVNDGSADIIYTIVGDTEADPLNKKISLYSPIGRSLAGKKTGDIVIITTPSGQLNYSIVEIS